MEALFELLELNAHVTSIHGVYRVVDLGSDQATVVADHSRETAFLPRGRHHGNPHRLNAASDLCDTIWGLYRIKLLKSRSYHAA